MLHIAYTHFRFLVKTLILEQQFLHKWFSMASQIIWRKHWCCLCLLMSIFYGPRDDSSSMAKWQLMLCRLPTTLSTASYGRRAWHMWMHENICVPHSLWTRRVPCAKCPAVVRAQIRQDGTHQALIDHTHTKHEAWQGVNCHFLSSFPTAGLWVQTQRKDSIFRSGLVSIQPWKGS